MGPPDTTQRSPLTPRQKSDLLAAGSLALGTLFLILAAFLYDPRAALAVCGVLMFLGGAVTGMDRSGR
jgi:hypothetical protein